MPRSETTSGKASNGSDVDAVLESDANPRLNWPTYKRWTHIIVISVLGLVTNLAPTICAPGASDIVSDLDSPSEVVSTLAVTVYVLGVAVGPMALGPMSEIYGRVLIYHIANVVFVAFVIGDALSKSVTQFIVFRFLSGCAGSVPMAPAAPPLQTLPNLLKEHRPLRYSASVPIVSHSNKRMVAQATAQGQRAPSLERRLLPIIWFSPSLAVGLFIYGWAVEYRVRWILPIVGTAFIGFGTFFVLMPAQLYLVNLFGSEGAGSALGASLLLRYVSGTFLPLAGPKMYQTLHYGWDNTLLGLLALAFLPFPIVFYKYGERLRATAICESGAGGA